LEAGFSGEGTNTATMSFFQYSPYVRKYLETNLDFGQPFIEASLDTLADADIVSVNGTPPSSPIEYNPAMLYTLGVGGRFELAEMASESGNIFAELGLFYRGTLKPFEGVTSSEEIEISGLNLMGSIGFTF